MAAEDYFFGYWGQDGPPEPEPVECKFCGRRWLRWRHFRLGWRLVDEDGEIHNCLAQSASADEFDDVSGAQP